MRASPPHRVSLPPLSDLAAKLDQQRARPTLSRDARSSTVLPTMRIGRPSLDLPSVDLSAYAHTNATHRQYAAYPRHYRPTIPAWPRRSDMYNSVPVHNPYRAYEEPRLPAYEERFYATMPREQSQPTEEPLPLPKAKRKSPEVQAAPVQQPPAKVQRTHARSSSGEKPTRGKNNENHVCQGCSATSTPEWRKGPTGPRTLCNACGLLYAKMWRKREHDAIAAAAAYNIDPAEVRKNLADSLRDPKRREEVLEALREDVRIVASAKQSRMNLSGNSRQSITPKRGE
ncbi:hypothetical protein MCUN1_002735 [Malassezia cuniculi]|uniref:GATA-type domain-containing protein n=1 Tax=Malassezia cuniculi TaxID=948313 RepID=A0AAF0EW77_9BASI|nr:hypothetical protein MCUN1_002735 [Malassezia cuniculi]